LSLAGCSLVIESGLTPPAVLVPGGVQFLVGSMLQGDQGVVGIGQGVQDLVELALRRTLMPRLGVLNDEDHGKGQRSHQALKDDLPPSGKPGGDTHADPCNDRSKDHQRRRGPRGKPVDPRQPPAN